MSFSLKRPIVWVALVACFIVLLLAFFAVTSSAAPPPGDEQFGVIADANNAYLNTTPAGIVPGTNYMDTPTLMALLDDNGDGIIGDAGDDPSNDPLVIDVRGNADYQGVPGGSMGNGHIPGAINVPFTTIDKPASLLYIRQQLALHQTKEIVLACYSGHTDKEAEIALGAVAQAGYFGTPAPEITALKWGNLGWNSAAEPGVLSEVTPGPKDIYVHLYGMETTPHALPSPGAYPLINNTTSTEPAEITRAAEDLNINPGFIFPGTNAGQVNDTNIGNYTVVDVRTPAEYAAGHITGAVNIPYTQLFAKDAGGDYTNALSIDTSKPVIVYANGQQESNSAAVGLNAIGIRNAGKPTQGLRYGLASWNYNYGMEFLTSEEHSYPIVVGPAPGGVVYNGQYCSGVKPSLSMGAPHAYWAQPSDYTNHILTVDWTVSNTGTNIAYDVAITGSTNNNGVVTNTALPLTVANIMSPGGSGTATLTYNVGSASWFRTTMTGGATDICGSSYTYP